MAEESQNINIANAEENNHQNLQGSPEIILHSNHMEHSIPNDESIGPLSNDRQMEIPAAKVSTGDFYQFCPRHIR